MKRKRQHKFDPDPVIEVYKKDLDRTLFRENLKLSVEERFLKLMELNRLADELRTAGKQHKQSWKQEQHD